MGMDKVSMAYTYGTLDIWTRHHGQRVDQVYVADCPETCTTNQIQS